LLPGFKFCGDARPALSWHLPNLSSRLWRKCHVSLYIQYIVLAGSTGSTSTYLLHAQSHHEPLYS
jgi:hypothetical protein